MDGKQVMEFLELPPSPTVGKAMSFLLDLRLEEGLLGHDEVRARLRAWWVARGE
jgi:poly(A) polymerase